MAELTGRKVKISIGAAPTQICVARTKTLTISNEMIDVTSDCDDGVQRFLEEPGQKAVEISVEGMFDQSDETLTDLALSNTVAEDVELDFGTYTISGRFVMPSFTNGMTYNDAATFSATFQSSGAVVKAPAGQ